MLIARGCLNPWPSLCSRSCFMLFPSWKKRGFFILYKESDTFVFVNINTWYLNGSPEDKTHSERCRRGSSWSWLSSKPACNFYVQAFHRTANLDTEKKKKKTIGDTCISEWRKFSSLEMQWYQNNINTLASLRQYLYVIVKCLYVCVRPTWDRLLGL